MTCDWFGQSVPGVVSAECRRFGVRSVPRVVGPGRSGSGKRKWDGPRHHAPGRPEVAGAVPRRVHSNDRPRSYLPRAGRSLASSFSVFLFQGRKKNEELPKRPNNHRPERPSLEAFGSFGRWFVSVATGRLSRPGRKHGERARMAVVGCHIRARNLVGCVRRVAYRGPRFSATLRSFRRQHGPNSCSANQVSSHRYIY
jgi:hypothetical protein